MLNKNAEHLQQNEIFREEFQKDSSADFLFMNLIRAGLTRRELQTRISKSPKKWGKYSVWLDRLP